MCNKRRVEAKIDNVMKRFSVIIPEERDVFDGKMHSAFEHTKAGIIRAETPGVMDTDYHWGLVPKTWNKPKEQIWNSTYNAKIEEVHQKYSFRSILNQRCLIPTSFYYEYHWNDPKGRSKTLYEVWHPDDEIFCLAGLYSSYTDSDGSVYNSYTILTTQANQRMKFVHNKDAQIDYHRMPVMLNPGTERDWLDLKNPHLDFSYPNYKPLLIANPAG
ncbi:SOS response-associated peptidase [Flavobacterium magnum]|nr:SOS response-associated peptidase family protein [Flavobacterium magnum]